MTHKNSYTLAQVQSYNPKKVSQYEIKWRNELLVYGALSLVLGPSTIQPDFGKGFSLLTLAFAACILWNMLGRKDGIVLSVFRYFCLLTILGWLNLGAIAVTVFQLIGLGMLLHFLLRRK